MSQKLFSFLFLGLFLISQSSASSLFDSAIKITESMSELTANAERLSQKDLSDLHSISVRKIKAIANDEYSEWAILDSLLESVNRFQIKQGVYRQLSDSEFEILVASYLVIMEQTLFSETN